MSRPRTIDLSARIVDPIGWPGGRARCQLTYDPENPFEVVLYFHEPYGGDVVPWTFARDLLDPAADAPAVAGDVRITWSGDEMILTLCGSGLDEGATMTFAYPADKIARFLADTYRHVPRGREALDLDAELRDLLA